MKKYTYKKQGDGRDSWTCKVYDGDTVIDSYMVYESPLEIKKKEVSDAFDLHFERMWRAKGYTSFDDLNSHAANANSVYNTEALSLIQWSHDEWEAAIADIDEQSNIQEIINSLQVYE